MAVLGATPQSDNSGSWSPWLSYPAETPWALTQVLIDAIIECFNESPQAVNRMNRRTRTFRGSAPVYLNSLVDLATYDRNPEVSFEA